MKDKIVAQAILELKPNIGITVTSYETVDETFNNTIFDNETDKTMSLEDVKNKITEIENRDAHIEPRLESYPSILEQFDMQYWDSVNGTTTWADAIAKVKADNPKN
jgi:hypothetical protein